MLVRSAEELMVAAKACKEKQSVYTQKILVCAGTGCVASGSLQIYEALDEEVKKRGIAASVQLKEEQKAGVGVKVSGCHGFCEMGPLVRIEPEEILYTQVTIEDVPRIIEETIVGGKIIEELTFSDGKERYHRQNEIPFYKKQTRVILSNCGRIDPNEIDEYLAHDGYQAIAKALTLTPEETVNEVEASGLRGRGGGGFLTGRKWRFAMNEPGPKKYIICNGDEGDPGAFMDRSIMEGDPHNLIEGMLIAAYAIGADEGYIYVRAEYPLAVTRLRKAIDAARQSGFLGENILGSDFSFDLKIKEGAGAFVCGEETALIASIEGERGMPMPKPPFPAQSGLYGKPTVINNVETFANLPTIIKEGAGVFARIGTKNSTGTKTFALTGEVRNTGLIEVPMGTSLREIVYDIGGGVRGGSFKAVQIGGPSGGCLTKEHLDLGLDFDSLQEVGAMIGSGGLVVMNENTCMVEVARFFMNFTQNESCGKCVLCREGTKQMLNSLQSIVDGEADETVIPFLQELGECIHVGSLCGLGKTASSPVLTTIQYFEDEYLAHVRDKRCPAGVCSSLASYSIEAELCKGCTKCIKICPVDAISGERKQTHVIDEAVCIKCGACIEQCPFNAIKGV